jgi:hypothetical protein
MPPIVTTIMVDRCADDVFAYATDPTRFSEWQLGVTGGDPEDGGRPSGRGATPPVASAARTPQRLRSRDIDPPGAYRP